MVVERVLPPLLPATTHGSQSRSVSALRKKVSFSESRGDREAVGSEPPLDPTRFGGHSLRAGFVTAAADRGAPIDRIMDHTGHQSAAMVRTYTRRTDAFAQHAGEGLL